MAAIEFELEAEQLGSEPVAAGSVDVLERATPAIGNLALSPKCDDGRRETKPKRGTEEAAAEVLRLVRTNGKSRVEADVTKMDLVQIYLTEIGRYPLLTKDDEVRLSAEIAAGRTALDRLNKEGSTLQDSELARLMAEIDKSELARRTFIQGNLRLVAAIAKKNGSSSAVLLDKIQLGNQGLMHAVEKFDGRKGFKFSTYATWWIKVAMSRGIEKTGRLIAVPLHVQETMHIYQRASERFVQDHQRNGTRDEIIAYSQLDMKKTKEALWFMADVLSLNDGVNKDSETELGDLLADNFAELPEDAVTHSLTVEGVVEYLDILNKSERRTIELYFGIGEDRPYSLDEIAEVLNVDKTYVAVLRSRAFAKLRHPTSGLMLGIDEWREAAKCLGLNSALFFPSRGEETKNAREVCVNCPSKKDCLKYALKNTNKNVEKYGIWGGTSERERRKLRSPK